MKWAVDRIVGEIAVLENLETAEKKEVATTLLPSSIKDGSILRFENNTYREDILEEEVRRLEIYEQFKRLRSKE